MIFNNFPTLPTIKPPYYYGRESIWLDQCVLSVARLSLREHVPKMFDVEDDEEKGMTRATLLNSLLRWCSIFPHSPCDVQSNDSKNKRQKCCECSESFHHSYTHFLIKNYLNFQLLRN